MKSPLMLACPVAVSAAGRLRPFVLSVSIAGILFFPGNAAAIPRVHQFQAASSAKGRLQVVAVSSDGAAYYRATGRGSCWSDWIGLGGHDLRQVDLARNADGRLELFALGSDGAVYNKWERRAGDASSWSDWSPLYGQGLMAIDAAVDLSGRLTLFALSADGSVYMTHQSSAGGGWLGWRPLGGSRFTKITSAANADGRLEVFGLDASGAVFHAAQTPRGTWSGWETLYGRNLTAIATASNQDGRIELFALSADGSVYHRWQTAPNSSDWANWETLYGQQIQQISVGQTVDGRVALFAIGGDGAAYFRSQAVANGAWNNWEGLHGTDLLATRASTTARGLALLASSKDGRLYEMLQSSNGAWTSWTPLELCPNAQPTYRQLAEHWAPVVSQDVDVARTDADYLATFDFDGDWLAANNWDDLHRFPLRSAVYYWVIETNERWFVGYGFFHPRDWTSAWAFDHFPPSDAKDVQHINDLEGAILSVLKSPEMPFGRFEALTTVAHSDFFDFADDDTPSGSPWFESVAPSQGITDEHEDLDFVVDDVGLHPVLYVQAEGHGTYGHPLKGNQAWHTLDDWAPIFIKNKITDWRGADWSGTPCPPVSGNVSQCHSTSDWGDGVLYHFEGTRDVLAGESSHWEVAGYDLVSIKDLWDRRSDPDVFIPGSGGEFVPRGANAPWNWEGGAFFLDPAAFMNTKFGGWSVPIYDPQRPCAYTGNSFGAPINACIQK